MGTPKTQFVWEGNEYADFNPEMIVSQISRMGLTLACYEWGKYVGRADFEFYEGNRI
ncbi:hypothetical protein OH492_24510 [Vibrio chagasii]|nr:hypothetical protein [Vibrio chagasii]